MILMPSWTAVTSSVAIIRYDPSPTMHEDVAVGTGQSDAEAAGDLVTHAGVAVLDVVALRVPGPPQLVQVTGHRAGRADHDVTSGRTAR